MADAGYSKTPLLKKLGIRPEMKILLFNQPQQYAAWLQTDIRDQLVRKSQLPDLIHIFSKNSKEFIRVMKKILPMVKKNSSLIIWVSWYKKSSGMNTDLTEDFIRKFAIENGLVDIKVCAVDDVWSGLKLVVPLSKR